MYTHTGMYDRACGIHRRVHGDLSSLLDQSYPGSEICESFYKRYVVEDRHFAIRSALSIAEEKDV
eukprot:scaffold34071_cov38-Prasinocladus_malaysianus.AAC.2